MFNAADTDDDGELVDWGFTTRTYSLGSFMDNSYFRRGGLSIATLEPMTVTVETAYSSTATVQSNAVSVPVTVGHEDIRVSWDMMRVSPAVYFLRVSGSGSVSIRGIEVQGTARPLTKVTA